MSTLEKRINYGKVKRSQIVSEISPTSQGYGKKYDYDAYGRASRKVVADPADLLLDYNQISNPNEHTYFQFDSTSPLRESRVISTPQGDEDTSYSINHDAGRYNAIDETPLSYNENGSIVENESASQKYTFDALGRLTEVRTNSDEVIERYSYDPLGRLTVILAGDGELTVLRNVGDDTLVEEVQRTQLTIGNGIICS